MGRLITLGEEHRELVHRLRDEAEQWLAERGLEQYNGVRARFAHADLDRLLDTGAFYGWEDEGRVCAVAALDGPDMDFWNHDEAEAPAAYIGRLMVAEHGQNWGAQLINALAARARESGQSLLRLDCWRDNAGLHAYYRRCGFQLLRIETVPGRQSGALFERALTP